ncbi:MAG: DUF2339 domain-containing protein [Desulfotomaculaceae bacterium]|nr:DUF2339 domain-containing protein [Desulfotomaculaceae bacterium]
MADQEDLTKRLALLEDEVNSLKSRLSSLENQVDLHSSSGKITDPAIIAEHSPRRSLLKTLPTRDSLESLIGGQLLNRIGIVILLFGVAYFLKYAFDNDWINETGRIIIGLIAGISLLAAGDVAMNRRYTYFSQGLTGGGIAVIYLTTFAAANYYHIFNPPVAFGLLVVTALAGGFLSVRQNAFSVAILSTIGGFLSPFLIGSQSSQAIPLLSYIVILDLVILYLAYYNNWRSLNLLSFAGTAIVYILYNSQTSFKQEALVIELFLAAFFVIFGTLAFFYNVRHQKPTKAPDVLLMVGNIAFFLAASLGNLYRFSNWHGLFVISLAVLYLVVSLNIQRRKSGDNLLFLSLLGIGLALVTIAIPIQLEGMWINIAWLVEAVVLVYAGVRAENKWVWRTGLLLLIFSSLIQATQYVPITVVPVFNFYSLAAYLAIAGFFLVFYWFYSRAGALDSIDRNMITWPAAVLGAVLALKQIAREVAAIVHYYRLGFQDIFAVSLTWAVLAIIFMAIGMIRDIKGFRYISLALFGITVIKIMLFDLSNLAMVFRVVILLAVGAILVGVSFAYLRKERGEQK